LFTSAISSKSLYSPEEINCLFIQRNWTERDSNPIYCHAKEKGNRKALLKKYGARIYIRNLGGLLPEGDKSMMEDSRL